MCDWCGPKFGFLTQDGCFECQPLPYIGRDVKRFGATFFEHGHGGTVEAQRNDLPMDACYDTNTTKDGSGHAEPPNRNGDKENCPKAPFKMSTNLDSLFSPFPEKAKYVVSKREPTDFYRLEKILPPKKKADTTESPIKRMKNEIAMKEKPITYNNWRHARPGVSLFDTGEAYSYLSSSMHLNSNKSLSGAFWYTELPSYKERKALREKEAEEHSKRKSQQQENKGEPMKTAPEEQQNRQEHNKLAEDLLDLADQQEKEDTNKKAEEEDVIVAMPPKPSKFGQEHQSMKKWLQQHGGATSFRMLPMPIKKKEPVPPQEQLPRGTKSRMENVFKALRPMAYEHFRQNPRLLKKSSEEITARLNQCLGQLSVEAKEIPETFKSQTPKKKAAKPRKTKNNRKSAPGGGTGEE
ncbi:unknown protein [Seminavis robusta]|uniref:Uncharacterized protein n=1 Tax=Seminavis robusta TaxID=568900 RepID=A0A9N8HSK1_9STRA|nr:unknown protein [Seminavis robusta]|eukprot:Sro1395_g269040.1 n/a (409) ;mRNA; f:6885-8111